MGSKGSTTTKQSFSLPPEFRAAYKKSIDMATQATASPYEAYTGQLVAGMNPTQQQGIANVNAAQGMALPAISQGIDLTRRAAQGITPELYQQFYSPYTRDVANTTMANLMESSGQQRSGLKSGAIQAGAFGGDRGGIAQAEMARQQNLALGQTMGNIYNQGYGQAMQLAGQQAQNYGAMGQQLAGLGVGAQGSVLQGAQAQMAAGAQQQATDQAQLQAAYEQWMQRQAYPYQQAQFFANIAQGLGAGAGGTSSTTTPGPSLGSQILGGLGAVGSIFSMSDKRVKENIEAVGTLNDGQTIYRYNFKGDPKTQIGLLAQEVETREPGAVTDVKGLKMVDYKDATDKAASMGGLVTPDMEREAFAAGGSGGPSFYPYASLGYVPEGKIQSQSNSIPKAPPPFEDKGLAEDWKNTMPLTEEQIGGLKALANKIGVYLERPEKSALGFLGDLEDAKYSSRFEDEYPEYSKFASGGVVGRNGYFMGGEPTMEDAMEEAKGLSAAETYEPPSRLLRRESGGDFGARNEQGYVGRAQFGPERLEDAKRAGVIPVEMGPEEFRANPRIQEDAEAWHFSDINNFIDKSGLAAFEGKSINGIPVTREGMVNVAHLGGKNGLQKFLSSGGRYNPADANGTSLSDYLAMGASQSGVAGAQIEPMADTEAVMPEEPRSRFDISKIFASEENPSLVETIMGRRLSPAARAAVMNASFAMLAGRSPFMGVNIGEAGKVGMQTYYNALQQNRELAKQQADIERQAYEAQTGRLSAQGQLAQLEVARLTALMPLLQQYTTAGQPIPPALLNLVNREYPEGTEARAKLEADLGGPLKSAAEVPISPVETSVPGETETSSAPAPVLPSAGETEEVAEEAPVETSMVSPELADIYKNVPNITNPIYYEDMARKADRKADIARNASPPNLAEETRQREAAEKYRETARKIIETDRKNKVINVPGRGNIPFPGVEEQDIRTITVTEKTRADVEALKKENETIADLQSGFSGRAMTLDGIRDAITRGETGSLAELKSQVINFMNEFGMANADMVADATDVQVIIKYFAESLANNPKAKENLGPSITNADIELIKRGTGSVELLAGANRRILGALYGKLLHDRAKVEAWLDFTEGKDSLPQRDIIKFNNEFGKKEKLSEYVERATADTPVAGEIVGTPKADFYKVGWKYVDPRNGRIFKVIDKDDNGLPISEYVQ